jgi:hypothetical protein
VREAKKIGTTEKPKNGRTRVGAIKGVVCLFPNKTKNEKFLRGP